MRNSRSGRSGLTKARFCSSIDAESTLLTTSPSPLNCPLKCPDRPPTPLLHVSERQVLLESAAGTMSITFDPWGATSRHRIRNNVRIQTRELTTGVTLWIRLRFQTAQSRPSLSNSAPRTAHLGEDKRVSCLFFCGIVVEALILILQLLLRLIAKRFLKLSLRSKEAPETKRFHSSCTAGPGFKLSAPK